MENREIVCIGCPMGCMLSVTIDGESIGVCGNECKVGERYAQKEVTDPRRIVTTSVKGKINGENKVIAVKTNKDIPKNLIDACLLEIKKVFVEKEVSVGDVLIENILGTGSDIVVTSRP